MNTLIRVLTVAVMFVIVSFPTVCSAETFGLTVAADVYGRSSNIDYGVPWNDQATTFLGASASERLTGLTVWWERADVSSGSQSPESDNFGDQTAYGFRLNRQTASGRFAFNGGLGRRTVEEPLSLTCAYPAPFPVTMDIRQWDIGGYARLFERGHGSLGVIARYASFAPTEKDSNAHNPLKPYFPMAPHYALPELASWHRVTVGLAGEYTIVDDLMASGALEYAKTGAFYGLIPESSGIQLSARCAYRINGYLSVSVETALCRLTNDAGGYLEKWSGYVGPKISLQFPATRPR